MSLVSVVCYQVEFSALSWSLVRRSPSECGVSRCDREASIMWRPWSTRRSYAMEKKRKAASGDSLVALTSTALVALDVTEFGTLKKFSLLIGHKESWSLFVRKFFESAWYVVTIGLRYGSDIWCWLIRADEHFYNNMKYYRSLNNNISNAASWLCYSLCDAVTCRLYWQQKSWSLVRVKSCWNLRFSRFTKTNV